MQPKKVGDAASIVLVGSFNPRIFHPTWFLHHGLIQSVEAEAADVQVVSNEVAIFQLKWLRIEVLRERFLARTSDESQFGPLCDLVVGTFRLLEHTPVKQMGLNRDIQFAVDTAEQWHGIGHTLAPKEIWRTYLQEPGLTSIGIRASRTDNSAGNLNVTLRPVLERAQKGEYVIEVAVNSHYEFGEGPVTAKATKAIENDWEISLQSALRLAQGILYDAMRPIR